MDGMHTIIQLVSSAFFDKLFCYIAPADAIVCQNAHQTFGIACSQQVVARLVMPKKRKLLLAWPFCNHTPEDASNPYKQAKFYATLRSNLNRSGRDCSGLLLKFLTHFELFMLQSVLDNAHTYTDLNVLMLDFHDHDELSDERFDDVAAVDQPAPTDTKLIRIKRNEWFACEYRSSTADTTMPSSRHTLSMASKLWGKVINAVVAQCCSSLRHFVFVSSSSRLQIPNDFYKSLHLDYILAQLQQLETLYMPSIVEYEQARFGVIPDRHCWEALRNLPVEKRLPNLRRIVLNSPECLEALGVDKCSVLAAFGNNFATVVGNSKTRKSQQVVVQVVAKSEEAIDVWPPKLNNCTVQYVKTLAHNTVAWPLSRIMCNTSCDNPKFINSAQQLLQNYADCRLRLQSISGGGAVNPSELLSETIPACLTPGDLSTNCAIGIPARFLTTLSSRLTWPLSLTLKLDGWRGLLTLRRLFTNVPNDKNYSHWTECFSRGVLKLRLIITNDEGWEQYIANAAAPNGEFQYLDKSSDFLRGREDYDFPPDTTVELKPSPIIITYGVDDNMPAIRQYYEKSVQHFIADVTGDEPIAAAGVTAAMNAMCRSLYETCQRLVISFKIVYKFPVELGAIKANAEVGRIEEMVHDEQFEKELLKLFGKFVDAENEYEVPCMPSLKSISIKHNVSGLQPGSSQEPRVKRVRNE